MLPPGPMRRSSLFALAALAASACDHRPEDFTPLRARVSALQQRAGGELDRLAARHAALLERTGGLPGELPGVADAAAALSSFRTRLDEARGRLATAREDALRKIEAQRRKPAEDAVDSAGADLRARAEKLATILDAQERVIAEAEATAAAAAAAPPPAPRQPFQDPGFAFTAGTAPVYGLAWKGAGADLDLAPPASRAAADALVAFANSCDALRFTVTVHTAKDGLPAAARRLSTRRAEALRAYLLAQGVPARRITSIEGVGGTRPLAAEPEPGTPAEQALPPAELQAIREQNRRLTLAVVTPCPEGSGVPGAAAPPR